ncbi:MAG: response regulator [Magnetococcales bacterium]|nr:response regulator [Magnetococcales bacterium]
MHASLHDGGIATPHASHGTSPGEFHGKPRSDGHDKLLRVLLVEDSEADQVLVRENADSSGNGSIAHLPRLRLTPVVELRQAIDLLSRERFDAALLDLNLPDSIGMETFLRIHDKAPDLAIVVLTGLDDDAMGADTIRHGAQDFLSKGSLDGPLLLRSLRYAVERQRLINELDRTRRRRRQEQEIQSLEKLSHRTPGDGLRALSLERVYSELVRHYVVTTREGRDPPREEVRNVATRLMAMHAGARDVVLLHLKMLRGTGHWTTTTEERAFSQDARLVLVELLGHLTDLYRERAQS